MLNCVILQGRLTADPELRHTQAGTAATSFTVAHNKDENTTHFIDCTAWGNTATWICDHFHKGKEILLRGDLRTREWQTKEGYTRRRIEINVQEAHFCGPKDQNTSRAATVTAPAATAPSVSISAETTSRRSLAQTNSKICRSDRAARI